ncbi:unnamed protein product [Allacma fusca]|uniref:Uncharacterized protein n=1 Tax=Allacma fusca TaxID=39272 RepID=A0A8J2JNU7_9HEXA|nr:unnamed protein product [Allacma fusca]
MSGDFAINMKNFWTYILLFTILANFSARANGDSNIQGTARVPTEISEEESAELFPAVLQDNYRNGFYQLFEVFQTTNSTLTKLREKLDGLENKIEVLNTDVLKTAKETKANTDSLKQEIDSFKKTLSNDRTVHSQQIQSLKSQIVSKLDGLERTQNLFQSSIRSQDDTISSLKSKNSKMAAALFKRDAEGFFGPFTSLTIRNGNTFNGSTFEAISAAVPADNMLVAQIKNYMDVDLTGYQLHLHDGFVVAPAPNKIAAKTAEVATFVVNKQLKHAAQPEMSYRMGDTDISLHLYFVRGKTVQTFAAALLPRSAPAKSIISFDCTHYNHSGSARSHKCVTNVGLNSTNTFTVYEGDISIFEDPMCASDAEISPCTLVFQCSCIRSQVHHQKSTFQWDFD